MTSENKLLISSEQVNLLILLFNICLIYFNMRSVNLKTLSFFGQRFDFCLGHLQD